MEERSRASVVRPAADRLARRAFAWLEEVVSEGPPPWGYFLRPGANAAAVLGTRPEKSPVLNGSMVLLELVLKAFGTSRDIKHRKVYGRFFMDQRENLDKLKS